MILQRILQEITKKIILGTSDAWSMSRSSYWHSNQHNILKIVRFYTHFQNSLVFYESRWLSCSWADNHTCADGISLWCGGIVEFLLVSEFQIGHLVYESQIKVGIILLCLWRASAVTCLLDILIGQLAAAWPIKLSSSHATMLET